MKRGKVKILDLNEIDSFSKEELDAATKKAFDGRDAFNKSLEDPNVSPEEFRRISIDAVEYSHDLISVLLEHTENLTEAGYYLMNYLMELKGIKLKKTKTAS